MARDHPHELAAGRTPVLRAVAELLAVAASSGTQRWVVVDALPGHGGGLLLDRVLELAADRGRSAARVTPRAGDGVAPVPAGGVQVLAIDDLQWLGRAGLRAIERSDAEVVVATVRGGVPVADPAGLSELRAREGVLVLTLGPLGPDEVRARLGAADCIELTAGNPAMVAALREALGPAGDVAQAAADALPRVARFWDAHLDLAGPGARALAEAVAILDGDAPLSLAGAVADLDGAAAVAAAECLAASGLLASTDPVRRRIPLAWRALAGGVGEARGHELRRRAARRLAMTAGGVEAAAEHLLATPASGQRWVADVLAEAAEAALADGRSEAAVARLERALAEPLPRVARHRLLVQLGDARGRAASPGAVDAYREALRIGADGDRPDLHLRIGRSLYGAGDYRGAALELDRGLELVGDDDPRGAELIAAYIAAARFDRTLEDAAGRHLDPFLERSEPGRTPAERALLSELALERGIRGMPRDTVVRLALRAWADGLLLEGADEYGIALSQVAAALTWSDAFTDSIRVLTATIDHADRTGQAQLRATASYLRAWPRWYAGELAAAEADVRSALGAPGWEMYEPSARAVLGHVLLERGEDAEARDVLALADPKMWERTVPYAMLLETRSRVHAADGDLAAAAADLAEAGALLDSMGNRSPFCPWRSRLGVVRASQGQLDEARGLVEAELEQAEAIGTPRAIGTALHARGVVARAAGADGLDDLHGAAAVLDGCGARIEHVRTLVSLGVALTGAERRPDARTTLHRAVEIAEAAGAREIAEHAQQALRRAGGRVAGMRGTAGLTASELRVARLAARGRTNREIADELFVSSHTVRFHLAGVYRKLGIDRREDIAAQLDA